MGETKENVSELRLKPKKHFGALYSPELCSYLVKDVAGKLLTRPSFH